MNKKTLIYLMLLVTSAFFAACGNKPTQSQSPVSLTWQIGNPQVEEGGYENVFVLKNISGQPLPADWAIYFCQMPRPVYQTDDAPVKVEMVCGTFFKMSPTEHLKSLAAGDSVRFTFRCPHTLNRNEHAPEGAYWVTVDAQGKEGVPVDVDIHAFPMTHVEDLATYPQGEHIYNRTARLEQPAQVHTYDLIPSVKKATPGQGVLQLNGEVTVQADEVFASEAALLTEQLKTQFGIASLAQSPVSIRLTALTDVRQAVNDEYYTLDIREKEVVIAAASAHGIFNGTQSLLAMLRGQQAPYKLEAVSIQDYPDFGYRAEMIDISRDFTTLDNMKKLVDLFAAYKLNVLHFHFSDDEGWRLEIPGLEELTEVGAHRGHTLDESTCLYPAYDGGHDINDASTGSGYYTRQEFIDFLKYASARHITVIPEIETPGHARAAIVAMKARYAKYKDTDLAKAEEYLLSEEADTSRYCSVQYYDDNAMNVAMPSVYHFIDKVVREIKAMYAEADAPLYTIHLGGDEVPHGAWMGSPRCQVMMKENGWTEAHDLAEYFITRATGILKDNGLKMSGWQEVATKHTKAGDELLRPLTAGVNCWSDRYEDAYQIANNGYPVVVSSVCNFYMDMVYNGHPDERGYDWGGHVDEAISFAAVPFNLYRSLRFNKKGEAIDLDKVSAGKPMLTAEGRKNIIGVSGQLFSETIRNFDQLTYMLFPKTMGLVERGWNAHPAWENLRGAADEACFYTELSRYYAKIARHEMPYWKQREVAYCLPMPGIVCQDGQLLANSPIAGAEIRYTTDGSEPTATSTLWTAPVACEAAVVKAKAFYLGSESLTLTVKR